MRVVAGLAAETKRIPYVRDGNVIDGLAMARDIQAGLKLRLMQLPVVPSLAIVMVGNRRDSRIYVQRKLDFAEEIGVNAKLIHLPEETTLDKLNATVDELNSDDSCHGVIVQCPLPPALDAHQLTLSRVCLTKDVDGCNPVNFGQLSMNNHQPMHTPCTAAGIIEILKRTNTEIAGKRAVVIGRSNIVGRPTAILLLEHNATVTVCHHMSQSVEEVAREADILVSATGRPHMVGSDWVKPGAVVIDVGITNTDGEVYGDVDFAKVQPVAGLITPVPGGVGPMTVAMAFVSLVRAVEASCKERA